MATPRQLLNQIIRHQVLLEGVKTHQARKLAARFDEIEKAVRSAVLSLESDTLDKLTRKELSRLIVDIQAKAETAISRGSRELFADMREISDEELVFNVKSVQSLSEKIVLAVPTAKTVYARALAKPMSAGGGLVEPFVEEWSKREITKVTNTIQRGYSEGWTNQRLIQAVRGTKALGYKDGLVATSKRNAETVVRTSVQHVSNAGRMSLYEENTDVISRYSIIATLDGRTTQICRSLDKEIFEFGKGPVPPLHPNCRSTTMPELAEEWAFLSEGRTRASQDGPVDGKLTYYEWMKDQPQAFQNQALGPTRATLFRDGGLTADEFARLNLNRNFEPLTLDEMRKKAPLVFEEAGIE